MHGAVAKWRAAISIIMSASGLVMAVQMSVSV